MTECKLINPRGMHARAAATFVRAASKYDARIDVSNNGTAVDGKSILGLMTLGVGEGGVIGIAAHGRDADAAQQQLVRLVSSGFRCPTCQQELVYGAQALV